MDGEKGLELAFECHPDLIMLDMNMPRMSGMQTLRSLRSAECQSPVIFMTMYGSEKIAVDAFRLGVRDYLTKPFTIEEVEESVNRALIEKRLRIQKQKLSRNLVVAETVRQTVVTLAHYINNHIMVIDNGLRLTLETLKTEYANDPELVETIHRSLASAETMEAVIRVLRKVTAVRRSRYHGDLSMLDIDAAVSWELSHTRRR